MEDRSKAEEGEEGPPAEDEMTLKPEKLEIREEDAGTLILDYESRLEEGLMMVPLAFFLIACCSILAWFSDIAAIAITAAWLGISIALFALIDPFNEYYRIDRDTGEMRRVRAYGKKEWGSKVGSLRDAVFFGFDGRLVTRRRRPSYWTHRIVLFFGEGKTTPLTGWIMEPEQTLVPHVEPLKKALGVPFRELESDAERRPHPGPYTMDTVFEYDRGGAARMNSTGRQFRFIVKLGVGGFLLAALLAAIFAK